MAGRWASLLFAFGLLNASLFAASILPLSTAHVICEGLGFEAGIDHKFSDAPIFYWLYTILIVVGAGLILVPRAPLLKILFFSQVGNGIWLPIVLIFIVLLSSRKDLMGTLRKLHDLQRNRVDHQHHNDCSHAGSHLRRIFSSAACRAFDVTL